MKKSVWHIPKPRIETVLFWIDVPVIFLGLFVYLWIRINPALYYQHQEPVFFIGWRFLHGFLSYPGGQIDYVARFLGQFTVIPWLGALVISGLICALCQITRVILQRISGRTVHFIHYLPLAFAVALYSDYHIPLDLLLGPLFSMLVFYLFIRFIPMKGLYRFVFFLILFVVQFYIGAGSALLLALMAFLFEFAQGRSVNSLLCLLIAVLVPFVSTTYLFIYDISDSYLYITPFYSRYAVSIWAYALYLFFPLAVFGALVFRSKGTDPVYEFCRRPLIKNGLLFLVLITAAQLGFNKEIKNLLLVDYFASHGQWQKVLTRARKKGSDFRLVEFQTNRALSHLGRLPEDMFAFPQTNRGENLLMDRDFGLSAPMQNSDLYLDIGLVNQSEHWAYETMTLRGETPRVLSRLAKINIVKGEEKTARLFIDNLYKTLFFKQLARQYDWLLRDKTRIATDVDISRLRNLSVETDFIIMDSGMDVALENFLDAVPDNRVAFEYLMGLYLLRGQLDRFIERLPLIARLNYPRIPTLYEEALLFYLAQTGRKDIDLEGYRVSQETLGRYRAFGEMYSRYRNDKKAALAALHRQFGTTFWYYLLFQSSPRQTRENPIQPEIGGVR